MPATLAAALGVCLAGGAAANPQGGTVVGGSATINQVPGTTTIDQHSDRAAIDWQSFSINAGELTRFNQPDASSIALNRVVGSDPSTIRGRLEANGQVWLVNPSGVLFGPTAEVDVNGLVATTADIRNDRFLGGDFDFSIASPDADAGVVNSGTISFGESGLAALVAPHVRNDGVVAGRLGHVILAGAPTFTLDFQGDGLIQFAATSEVLAGLNGGEPLVDNDGTIQLEGGTVLITAAASAGIVDSVINIDGVVEARSIAARDGMIVLDGGDSGNVQVAGPLDATGAGGRVNVKANGDIDVNAAIAATDAITLDARDTVTIKRAVATDGLAEIRSKHINTTGAGRVSAGELLVLGNADKDPSLPRRGAGDAIIKGGFDKVAVGVEAPGDIAFRKIRLVSDRDIAVDTVAGVDGIKSQRATIKAFDHTVTVNEPITTTRGNNSITIVAKRFVNTVGPDVFTTGRGNYYVYTSNPVDNEPNGLEGEQVFGETFFSAPPTAFGQGDNVFVFQTPTPPDDIPDVIATVVEDVTIATNVTDAIDQGLIVAPGEAGAGSSEAAYSGAGIFSVPSTQGQGQDGDALFSNDGNHALWGLGSSGTRLPGS